MTVNCKVRTNLRYNANFLKAMSNILRGPTTNSPKFHVLLEFYEANSRAVDK